MADDVTLPGTGDVVAADEISGKKHQRVKIQHGAEGSATDVSSASPLPVADSAIAGFVDGLEGLLTTLGGFVDGLEGGIGASGDAAATQGSTGTVSAKLRLATSQLNTIAAALAGAISVDDDSGSLTVDGSVSLAAAIPAGTNTIGKLGANSGTDIGDVDVTSISAGSNLIGDVGIGKRTSGGLTIFRTLDLDETEEEVKATAGQPYAYYFANLHASAWRYLKFYNATAANVTVGTTTPVLTLPLPPNSAGHESIPQGIAFSTAITVAATTGLADNDTGAPGANEVVLDLYYA